MKRINFKSRLFLVGVIVTSSVISSCNDDDDNINPNPTSYSIVELVDKDTSFSILNAAIKRGGLATLLDAPGTLTVFAPDNNAFRKIGLNEATVSSLPQEDVANILAYHALGSTVGSSSVPASDSTRTLANKLIFLSKNSNGAFVNGSRIKSVDIAARNGVVHVIDDVLIPPTKTIAQIASENSNFSILVAAVVKAGLLDAVSGAGKYTVFAPTNQAFADAGFPDVASINAADAATIAAVVKQHVIPTNVYASDLINGSTAPTILDGTTLTVGTTPPGVKKTGSTQVQSNVVTTTNGSTYNITATNGVIHVIDKVIL